MMGQAFDDMKLPLDQVEEGADDGQLDPEAQTGGVVDYDMEVINCAPWNMDDSVFSRPEGIDFVDFNEMMPGAGAAGTDPQDNCAMCSQLPAGQQADCLSAMGCN